MIRGLALVVSLMLALTGGGWAQQLGVPVAPVLTIESETLFARSMFGQRVAREIAAEQSILLAENRRIEAELTAEERVLTDRRKAMSATDFRAVADAFDARVEEIRTQQDNKSREIAQRQEQEQSRFIQAARPVLAELMREAGASVILEQRTVLLSDKAVDVTEKAIQRLNTAIGDGTTLDPERQ